MGRTRRSVWTRRLKKMLDRKPFLTADEICSSVPSADALSRKYTSWLILKKHNFPSRVSGPLTKGSVKFPSGVVRSLKSKTYKQYEDLYTTEKMTNDGKETVITYVKDLTHFMNIVVEGRIINHHPSQGFNCLWLWPRRSHRNYVNFWLRRSQEQ